MKNLEILFQRLFFFGAFVLAGLAAFEKIANLLNHTLFRSAFSPIRLLEFAAIGLLFSIALQLHQIRILLSTGSDDKTK